MARDAAREQGGDDAELRYDKTAQRLLNLVFMLNSSPRPRRTEEIVGDPDLGYGSGNRDSDLRKFRRDRERLAQLGVIIQELRMDGASQTEESSWTLDRAQTFTAGGLIRAEDARLLMNAIDDYVSWRDTPLATPLRAIRTKAAEALGSLEEEAASGAGSAAHGAPTLSSDPTSDAIWTAFSLRRQLRFRYLNARGSASSRAVGIYGLFSHSGIAYIAGLDDATETVRTFRVDRIGEIIGLGSPYHIPDTFDVHEYLFLPFDLAPGSGFTARFSFPAARTQTELDAITYRRGALARADDGVWTWDVTARDMTAAASLALLHARDGMRPIAPPALVQAWTSYIERTVAAHEC